MYIREHVKKFYMGSTVLVFLLTCYLPAEKICLELCCLALPLRPCASMINLKFEIIELFVSTSTTQFLAAMVCGSLTTRSVKQLSIGDVWASSTMIRNKV